MGNLDSFKTVGAYILYEDSLVFMIGPDKLNEKLGVVRIGGHIEDGENLYEALKREIKEEADIEVNLMDSNVIYRKTSWDSKEYSEIDNKSMFDIKPLVIVGEPPSTAVFLAYAKEKPKPSSEAHGIVFFREKDIKDICSRKITLKEFVNSGGGLIEQKEMNYDLEMVPGGNIRFLFDLMEDGNALVQKYIEGEML